jgi:hypothetical protein
MKRFAQFDLTELKLIYRVLHQHLMEHIELMDADFFEDLQRWLQLIAQGQGVDVSDHSQWDAWLGNRHSGCAERVAQRTVIPFPSEDS